MACYHPLYAFYRLEDGKKDIVFANCEAEKHVPAVIRNGKVYGNKISLPCGMCIGCRLDYSKSWAVRCVLESLQYECNWFLTLTYDDDHLPITETVRCDSETGEVLDNLYAPSLDPPRLQRFMKDLRAYFDYHYGHDGIRFFGCGEYGDKSGRPHYHLLLFNCPLPDVELLKKSSSGCSLFRSEILDKLWPDGFAVVGELTYSSCAYTARYIMKKQKGPGSEEAYSSLGLVPEFVRMSRRPGIARSYYDRNSDRIYQYDQIVVSNGSGKPLEVKPPSYFDRLYSEFHPDEMFHVKQNRMESSVNRRRSVLDRTDLDEEKYLAVLEENQKDRCSRLVRIL